MTKLFGIDISTYQRASAINYDRLTVILLRETQNQSNS